MKWRVIRLVIWGIILGVTEYLFFYPNNYISGFYFLLGANIAYVIFLQIKRVVDLFRKDQKSFFRKIFNLSALEHLFWTFVVFLTILLAYGFPYIDDALLGVDIDLIAIFPALQYYESVAKDFLLYVNAGYFLLLLIIIFVRIVFKNSKHEKQDPPEISKKTDYNTQKQPSHCSSCKAALEPEDRFCPMCGSKILNSVNGG